MTIKDISNSNAEMLSRVKDLCDGKEGRPKNLSELATRIGIGKNSIYKWSYKKPAFDRVYLASKQLNTTVEYLIEGKKEDEKNERITNI